MAPQGVLSAIITPFTPDADRVDEAALRRLVDQGIEDGLNGFVPAGGTGEFSALSHAERRRVVEVVAEQANGRAIVMPNVGATSSREAIELATHAQQAGATAIMLVTPYYDGIGEEEAFAYFARVAEATDLPICAYNYPHATGFHLGVDFILRLAREIPQVKFVKDSSADILQMSALVGDHTDKVTLFNGEDVLLLQAAALGAKGMILGTANFMAPALMQIFEASKSGDDAQMVSVWRAVNPVIRFLVRGRYNSGVKAACEILGLPAGPTRAPIRPYDEAEKAVLREVLGRVDRALLTRSTGFNGY